jgi:hypothetical protein
LHFMVQASARSPCNHLHAPLVCISKRLTSGTCENES